MIPESSSLSAQRELVGIACTWSNRAGSDKRSTFVVSVLGADEDAVEVLINKFNSTQTQIRCNIYN